ncbi:hypothetical protein [Falsihalocynthiibacter arcticus]|uniref:Uncharacterized protein n=1 Tax=Falsihalocynthiibacter arcticus TaxID=1579316 RepID=A0A126UY09_9RHOB|nr:hypothetical protein [Falsihalocynthiibacter arcticus]AML50930.1 hypothetical protein RC74_06255 [Falsihalocynthiibacter arcticus]
MTGMTRPEPRTRAEIAALVSPEFVAGLRDLIGSRVSDDQMQSRLIHILTRFEIYAVHAARTVRKTRKLQLTQLRDKAQAFLTALSEMDEDVLDDVDAALNRKPIEALESVSFEDEWPEEDQSIPTSQIAASRIIDACRDELTNLAASDGQTRHNANMHLDQPLLDLEALFESETGKKARSACYYVDIEEDFTGSFMEMTVQVIQRFHPDMSQTRIALGTRIRRVLKDD